MKILLCSWSLHQICKFVCIEKFHFKLGAKILICEVWRIIFLHKLNCSWAAFMPSMPKPLQYRNKYSLLFNTSHGILIREKWDFPPNPFIPAWSLSKSLLCLLLHPGLKPFLFTWKQWWCHCYINRGLLCSVFQPGLWVNGMACLVIQTCFWKKSGMSPNTTWLVLKRKE